MKAKIKIGTIQMNSICLIPFVLYLSKSNLNFDANMFTIHLFLVIHIGFSVKRKSEVPKTNNIVDLARYYGNKWHRDANQYYGSGENKVPYEFHLDMVEAEAREFAYLIPANDLDDVLAGCRVHDAIEDARVTYNDVKEKLGETVAEYSYALANEKGRNRKARANAKYYEGIKNYKHATFIKLCDRLANVKYSLAQKGKMVDGYRKENSSFMESLYDPRYKDMFKKLTDLLLLS